MIETATDPVAGPPLRFTNVHTQVYHIRCGHCGAVSVADVESDSVRRICPACDRWLTLPASVHTACSVCRSAGEYPHTLAGHSTACLTCGNPLTLEPVVGRARTHRRRHGGSRRRNQRTFAFGESAERSLFILVAAIATLVFIVAASIR